MLYNFSSSIMPSPWPMMMTLYSFVFFVSLVNMIHQSVYILLVVSLFGLVLVSYQWWRDVVTESTYQGSHTTLVIIMIKYGMILFIASEVMLFFSLFWNYFHNTLAMNTSMLGTHLPLVGLLSVEPYAVPLLNTLLLLSSGISVTLSHHSINLGLMKYFGNGMICTLFLGLVFMLLQCLEYYDCTFTMTDSVYGGSFYLTTGFHGFHVLLGLLALTITYIRSYNGHFSSFHYVGLELSIWYWHFVDVVWLVLFVSFYWWVSI